MYLWIRTDYYRHREKEDCMDRNVNIITDLDGKQYVLINDIRFKGKKREEWKEIEEISL